VKPEVAKHNTGHHLIDRGMWPSIIYSFPYITWAFGRDYGRPICLPGPQDCDDHIVLNIAAYGRRVFRHLLKITRPQDSRFVKANLLSILYTQLAFLAHPWLLCLNLLQISLSNEAHIHNRIYTLHLIWGYKVCACIQASLQRMCFVSQGLCRPRKE